MSFCPLMSNPKSMTDTESLFPCIGSCELLTKKGCSIKLIALSNNDKNKTEIKQNVS